VIKLPYLSPSLYLNKKIALVGSSGVLSGSGRGKEIDSFEEVIRFNRAPTNSYEEDVGSKTTVRVLNNHVFLNTNKFFKAEQYSRLDFSFTKNIKNNKIILLGNIVDLQRFRKSKENYYKRNNTIHTFDYSLMSDIKTKVNFSSTKNMSVGAVFLSLLLIAKTEFYIFGFDREIKDVTHYWQNRPKVMSHYHDQYVEKYWLNKIIKENRQVKYIDL